LRGFGPGLKGRMIWHHVGDEGLEIFLQWHAGRMWKIVTHSSRHSEWFNVTDLDPKDIVKHLRRWYAQIGLLDEWDAAQAA
jgi:hypothetical protein